MNKNLARAVAMAMTGTALSLGGASDASAAATTMYNMYRGNFAGLDSVGNPSYNGPTTLCAPCNNSSTKPSGVANDAGGWTDGWVWSANPQGAGDGNSTTPAFGVTPIGETQPGSASRPGWVGVSGSTPVQTTPFGYAGSTTLHWAVQFTGSSANNAEISNADSISRYKQSADVDTARGAWSDAALTGAAGWRHDLDFGLFKSDVTGPVTLSAVGVSGDGTTKAFGFTIFKGMDTSTGPYNHHGAWNAGNNTQQDAPTAASLPGGGFNLTFGDIVAYSVGGASPQRLNTITFDATAGQVYTIVLGGYKNGGWTDTTDGYKLSITQTPAAPTKFTLSVSTTATGTGVAGTVTSSPSGISCSSSSTTGCSADFEKDKPVTLTAAQSNGGSKFGQWGGDCSSASSTATCNLSMDKAKSVTAAFIAAPVTQYKLTVTKPANGTIKGTGIDCGVSTSDCEETVNAGTQIALTATGASGFQFSNWTGCTSSTSSCTVTMDGNKTVSASFSAVQPTQYTLTITPPSNGTITGTGINCGGSNTSCATTVNANAQVALTATAASGYQFSSWSGCTSSTASCTVTLDGNKTVSAAFAVIPPPDKFALTVTNNGNGSITSNPAGIDCGSTCSFAFDKSLSVTLTAAPADGYSFSGWGGACSGTDPCTVTMDAAKDVSANFTSTAPGQFALNVTKSGEGTVSSEPAGISCGDDCSESFDQNTNVTLTAAAAEGYTFSGWGGACSGTDPCAITMDAAKDVSAAFTATGGGPFALNVAISGSGSVTSSPVGIDCGADCTESYDGGTLVSLTATPATGWRFSRWTGPCNGFPVCTVSMSEARNVTAVFVLPPRHDFDGDGLGDLFWREPSTGRNNLWLMTGKTIKRSSAVTAKGQAWDAVALEDFDGDGIADVMWRRARKGENQIWLMKDGKPSAEIVLPDQARNYKTVRTGDFDQDGKLDLLWYAPATAEVSLWLMDGATLKSALALPNGPAGQSLEEVADFNGDGYPDVWWSNRSTGENTLWLMEGTAVKSTEIPPAQAPDWRLAGAGVFNGDNKADVLWRKRKGNETQLWLMDGATRSGIIDLPKMNRRWDIAGIDDYNGRGSLDILWRQPSTGRNTLWIMNGVERRGDPAVTGFSTGWFIPPN